MTLGVLGKKYLREIFINIICQIHLIKEEQECRIVKIEALANHAKVKLEGDKMFIETQAIGRFVDKTYFAPNASGMEVFQDKLIHYRQRIPCYQCEHPIRVTKS
jgi:hypothetical protein